MNRQFSYKVTVISMFPADRFHPQHSQTYETIISASNKKDARRKCDHDKMRQYCGLPNDAKIMRIDISRVYLGNPAL